MPTEPTVNSANLSVTVGEITIFVDIEDELVA